MAVLVLCDNGRKLKNKTVSQYRFKNYSQKAHSSGNPGFSKYGICLLIWNLGITKICENSWNPCSGYTIDWKCHHTGLMANLHWTCATHRFSKPKFWNKLSLHDCLRISFALNRQVYPVYIVARFCVSGIYSCFSNPHIPYLKANSIFRKSCVWNEFCCDHWLVGCVGFNGSLRHSNPLSERGKKEKDMTPNEEKVQIKPICTYCKHSRPLP